MLTMLDPKLIVPTLSPRMLVAIAITTAVLTVILVAIVGPDIAEAGRRRR